VAAEGDPSNGSVDVAREDEDKKPDRDDADRHRSLKRQDCGSKHSLEQARSQDQIMPSRDGWRKHLCHGARPDEVSKRSESENEVEAKMAGPVRVPAHDVNHERWRYKQTHYETDLRHLKSSTRAAFVVTTH
jgi:hypothetical protein